MGNHFVQYFSSTRSYRLVRPVVQHMRMEKDKECWSTPRLWKRVPVGTWVKERVREEGYKAFTKIGSTEIVGDF